MGLGFYKCQDYRDIGYWNFIQDLFSCQSSFNTFLSFISSKYNDEVSKVARPSLQKFLLLQQKVSLRRSWNTWNIPSPQGLQDSFEYRKRYSPKEKKSKCHHHNSLQSLVSFPKNSTIPKLWLHLISLPRTVVRQKVTASDQADPCSGLCLPKPWDPSALCTLTPEIMYVSQRLAYLSNGY